MRPILIELSFASLVCCEYGVVSMRLLPSLRPEWTVTALRFQSLRAVPPSVPETWPKPRNTRFASVKSAMGKSSARTLAVALRA